MKTIYKNVKFRKITSKTQFWEIYKFQQKIFKASSKRLYFKWVFLNSENKSFLSLLISSFRTYSFIVFHIDYFWTAIVQFYINKNYEKLRHNLAKNVCNEVLHIYLSLKIPMNTRHRQLYISKIVK